MTFQPERIEVGARLRAHAKRFHRSGFGIIPAGHTAATAAEGDRPTMHRLRDLRQHRALITFMLGHFTVDMFGGLMVILYALMKTELDLSNKEIGFVALAYS